MISLNYRQISFLILGICSLEAVGFSLFYRRTSADTKEITKIKPDSFFGNSGNQIGSLMRLTGVVEQADSDGEFRVKDPKGIDYRCQIFAQPNAPKHPDVGSTVLVLGFEEVVQLGMHHSVTSHLETRQIVVDSINGSLTQHPGGFGELRFEEVLWVLDIRLLDNGKSVPPEMEFLLKSQKIKN